MVHPPLPSMHAIFDNVDNCWGREFDLPLLIPLGICLPLQQQWVKVKGFEGLLPCVQYFLP